MPKFKDINGLFRMKGLVYSKLKEELLKKDDSLSPVNAVLIASGETVKVEENEEVENF